MPIDEIIAVEAICNDMISLMRDIASERNVQHDEFTKIIDAFETLKECDTQFRTELYTDYIKLFVDDVARDAFTASEVALVNDVVNYLHLQILIPELKQQLAITHNGDNSTLQIDVDAYELQRSELQKSLPAKITHIKTQLSEEEKKRNLADKAAIDDYLPRRPPAKITKPAPRIQRPEMQWRKVDNSAAKPSTSLTLQGLFRQRMDNKNKNKLEEADKKAPSPRDDRPKRSG